MFDLFKTKAEVASAEIHRVPNAAAALDFIFDTLRKEGVAEAPGAKAVWVPGPILGAPAERIEAAVPGVHCRVTRELAAESRIGVSEVDAAIADTGTLMVDATAVEHRLVSTLTEIHVAVVRTARIKPNLQALVDEMGAPKGAYLSLITGPSRTADIERVLTIGVHGPRRLIVVCVDDASGVN
ncbi:MAG: lactate utilization protein [Candidatus Polarisedimenticolia bacterium]|nr:lactate utilization protein [bacterium]